MIRLIQYIDYLQYCQMQLSRNVRVMERALLKNIASFVVVNKEWAKSLSLLVRVSYVNVNSKQGKEKRPKCPVCGRMYDNLLLFVVHLQLVHREEIEVTMYEFSQDVLTIYSQSVLEVSDETSRKYLVKQKQGVINLNNSLKERNRDIFTRMFAKFVKKERKQRRQYFHSANIFKAVRPESQGEDSQKQEVGQVERQLQKMRICDFTDVNQNDKAFFLKWNEAIYDAKRQNVYLNHQCLIELLKKFAVSAKRDNIKRINLVMHAWTLWSTAKITAIEVTDFLLMFDSCKSQ